MKRSSRKISKKNKPKDLRRITKPDGARVWIAAGKEYKTLKAVPNVKV